MFKTKPAKVTAVATILVLCFLAGLPFFIDNDSFSAENGGSKTVTKSKAETVIQASGVDVKRGNVQLVIPNGALDRYCNENNISEVIIDVRVAIERGKMSIIFTPDGLSFDEPALLKLFGRYALPKRDNVWLTTETGEAVEVGRRLAGINYAEFEISHFSSYAYDLYDYDY